MIALILFSVCVETALLALATTRRNLAIYAADFWVPLNLLT